MLAEAHTTTRQVRAVLVCDYFTRKHFFEQLQNFFGIIIFEQHRTFALIQFNATIPAAKDNRFFGFLPNYNRVFSNFFFLHVYSFQK